ncbi:tryptophan 7-halogenase [Bradyrhizobium sp. 31Argb]|uniref:NAD(P)/FAD-dependent oxidoreductase n=1 Tax=Bradyrhizobium sp. 31Argb TaxID=3141247 RepID=UPI003749305D
MTERQAVILGAGMAGMACARILSRRGIDALLVAPPSDVASRGETLSFRAGPYLETLGWHGLLDAETALVNQGSYSVWGNRALRRGMFHQEEMSGWHIDRYRLEARMAETLEADGVDRVFCEARQFSRSETGIAVELADGSPVNTRLLVDCSGRSAVTAGPAVTLRRLDKLVACYSVFTLDEDVEAIPVTLVEAVAIGWWYTSLLPGSRMLVGLFTDSDLLPAGFRKNAGLWADLASQTTAISPRLSSLGMDLAAAPELHFAAASALDPLAANGLATALWSGIQAAESVVGLLTQNDGTKAVQYQQQFLQGIASHLAVQTAMYASEHRFTDAPFWQRRRGPWLEN